MRDATLTKVTRNGQVTLPKSIRDRFGILEGDYVEVTIEDERVVLTPKKVIDASQAYFWTQEWQEGEREATQDIVSGRISEPGTAEDLIAALHKARREP